MLEHSHEGQSEKSSCTESGDGNSGWKPPCRSSWSSCRCRGRFNTLDDESSLSTRAAVDACTSGSADEGETDVKGEPGGGG